MAKRQMAKTNMEQVPLGRRKDVESYIKVAIVDRALYEGDWNDGN